MENILINGLPINKELLWQYIHHLHSVLDLETPAQWTIFDEERRNVHDRIYKSVGIDRYSSTKDNEKIKAFDAEFTIAIELILECPKCHENTIHDGVCPDCKEYVTMADKLKNLQGLKEKDIESVLNWIDRDSKEKEYNKLTPEEQKRRDTLYKVQMENVRLYTSISRALDEHPNDVFLKNAKTTIGDRGRHIDSMLDNKEFYDGN